MVIRSCQNLNSFLKESAFENAARLREVEAFTNSTVCNGLWAKYGTCCTHEKAIKAAIDQSDILKKTQQKTWKILEEIRGAIMKAVGNWNNSKINPEILFLRNITDNSVKNAIDRCWNHMTASRNAAYCFVCSGNSPDFFKNDKAAISLTECSTMLTLCSDFFQETLVLVNGMQTLVNSIERVTQSNFTNQKLWIEDLGKSFTTINLITDLQNLNSQLVKETKKNEIKVKLCENFYKLAKTPMLEQILPLFEFLESKLKAILDLALAAPRKLTLQTRKRIHQNQYSYQNQFSLSFRKRNWVTRQLNSNPAIVPSIQLESSSAILSGDSTVLFRESDNMFSSVVGSDGSPTSGSAVPMNLSMVFP